MATFGERLKLLRKSKGFTQEKMATAFNVERATLSKWEIDHTIPDVSTIKKIAEYFGCSVDFLLGISDNPDLSKLEFYEREVINFAEKLSRLPKSKKDELLRYGQYLFDTLNKDDKNN